MGGWPERARQAAIALSGDTEAGSIGTKLLADIRQIFHDKDVDRLPSKRIVYHLCAMSDRPWDDYRRGKGIGEYQVAKQLGGYDISPGSIHFSKEFQARHGQAKPTAKGYRLEQFHEAFTRYLG